MYDLTRKIALVTGIGGPVDSLGNGIGDCGPS